MTAVACWADRSFEFEPSTTALLVIDMQKDFFGPDAGDLPSAIPQVAAVTTWARTRGIAVIHTRESYDGETDVNPYKAHLGYVGRPGPFGRYLIIGERGHDFLEGFEPAEEEASFDKAGFSAFYGTDLEEHLRGRGITHVIICGITTQCCVHSTLRDAVDRGYFCLTVADACAAEERVVHDATMRIIQAENHLFGWICDTADLVGV